MKVMNQSARLLMEKDPMKHIERVARLCYKSEDKINDGHAKFCKRLFDNKHHAMLEHFRFIMEIAPPVYDVLSSVAHPYVEMTNSIFYGRQRFVISFNARGLNNLTVDSMAEQFGVLPSVIDTIRNELIAHIIRYYGCYELFGMDKDSHLEPLSFGVNFIENDDDAMSEFERRRHRWFSVHMVTDRGISHEIVRHRMASFAQESTRYCNYGKTGEIAVIDQGFNKGTHEYYIWLCNVENCEISYNQLIESGISPQYARSVLPTSVKTEIIMTAPVYEWDHFFDIRMFGNSGAPHPLMKKLASIVYDCIKECII